MSDVIRVHQLRQLLARPADIRAESLRSILRAAPAHVLVEDAQTGERFAPTVVGHTIHLAPR
jgi:hypothetical protein